MGAIGHTEKRLAEFSASFPYAYVNLLFAIPKGIPYSSFEKLFFPFNIVIWWIICVCFIVGFGLFIYLRLIKSKFRDLIVGTNNYTPFLNMINIFLGGPLNILPKALTACNLFIMWLFTSLILRAAYQGHLFGMLQSDKTSPPINTLVKLNHSSFLIYTTATFYNVIHKSMPGFQSRYIYALYTTFTQIQCTYIEKRVQKHKNEPVY